MITMYFSVRCYEEAESRGLPLFCAFQRRFDPTQRSVILKAKSGEIGQVQVIKTTSRDSPFPGINYLATSGGIFQDCSVHDVDVILNITGEAPKTVFVLGSAFHAEIGAIGDTDTVAIMMKFPSGVIGQIDLSRHAAYGYDQRLEVLGSKGMLQSHNPRPNAMVTSNEKGINFGKTYFDGTSRYVEAYAGEMEHFLDIIAKKAEPEVTKEGVLRVLRTLNAMETSWKTGQPVTIDN